MFSSFPRKRVVVVEEHTTECPGFHGRLPRDTTRSVLDTRFNRTGSIALESKHA